MTHLRWWQAATPDVESTPSAAEQPTATTAAGLVAEQRRLRAALSHIPHSLPEPHQHYPPAHPGYLESARLAREMGHL